MESDGIQLNPTESDWHQKVSIMFRTQKIKFLTIFKAITTYKRCIY